MKNIWLILLTTTLLIYATPSPAKIFDTHTTNIQFLRGHNYELGDKTRDLVTIDHANSWKYGDNHFFTDITITDNDRPNTSYAELSPRLSFGKISGRNLSYGIIKDVLIATNIEFSEGGHQNLLYGAGLDLDLPYFRFLSSNFYVRDNPILEGNTYQMTLIWNLPINIKKHKLLIEGFADFAGDEGTTYKENQLIVPRLLWDIGNYLEKPDHLFTGVEWQYWHNKYGGSNTESVPQVMIKWLFKL